MTFLFRESADGPNLRIEDPEGANVPFRQPSRALTLPGGVPLTVVANLTWEDASADLEVRLVDHRGARRCASVGGERLAGQATPAEACVVRRAGPFPSDVEWSVGIVNWASRASVPFEVRLTVATVAVLDASARAAFEACAHPWPCADGSEWPRGSVGPFGLARLEEVRFESHDGVELEGWIFHPAVPEGTRVPVVLTTSPYLGSCELLFNGPSSRDCNGVPKEGWEAFDAQYTGLVADGYAVAIFGVRGTGNSGGCFEEHGANEQQDYVRLVEHLAAQPWSNGRVGMIGLSYAGGTPFDAAIHAPPALKTVVAAGIITDTYTFYTSPQGAKITPRSGVRETLYEAGNGLTRPVAGPLDGVGPGDPSVYPQRACEDQANSAVHEYDWLATGDRHAAEFAERRPLDRFADVTASVLVVQGLLDNGGHRYQEDEVWAPLANAPKRMLLGQWGHEWPRGDRLGGGPFAGDWEAERRAWLDFWLKGVGEPPRLGVVDYEDAGGEWRATSSWPPTESRAEVLHLADRALSPMEATSAASFEPTPAPEDSLVAGRLPDARVRCALTPADDALVFVTEASAAPLVVAGNPFLYLLLESDRPHGGFMVEVFDVADATTCPTNGDLLTWGAVDLRYHAGAFVAEDFPVGEATPVRVDLYNLAHVVEPGRRLRVEVHGGEPWQQVGPGRPTLTLHPGSHLVLPLVEGTLGGAPPAIEYPPRPFVPT